MHSRTGLLLLAWLAGAGASLRAEPPAAPMLRIEAGMHTAAIRRISTDSAGRLVLTTALDKTARLWELPSGRMLRVLRPPLGSKEEGTLRAGALSPDGTLAAVGGTTGADNAGEYPIYIFDTATGKMVHRLTGLPNSTNDLQFSKRGRYLAAALHRGGGLRFWEVGTWREVGRDLAYNDKGVACLDWSSDGRLATTGGDGLVRLYATAPSGENRLQLLARTALNDSKEPLSVRFSPNGELIAVGCRDTRYVSVLGGRDLRFLFSPDTSGVNRGTLSSVGWSDDGESLCAGGQWQQQLEGVWTFMVRRWAQSGRGAIQDMPAAVDTILDLRALPGGAMLVAAADPAWGVLPRNGKRSMVGTPVADFRNDWEGFRVSNDGSEVTFGFLSFGKRPGEFSVARRQLGPLQRDNGIYATLHGTLTTGLPITDWAPPAGPKLSGKRLPLEAHETPHSLSVASDHSGFILGTSHYLRCFSAGGAEHWTNWTPGEVWEVNLTANDSIAVAAYSDGTIRWHRTDTGAEILSFFPYIDQKRWVLWTPEGYYDASANGEELIGWHVNRGPNEAADFFPASQFRQQFYRPDVISRVLGAKGTARALELANAATGRKPEAAPAPAVIQQSTPPVVELAIGGATGELKLEEDARSVIIKYRVRRTGSEPVTRVRLLVDGRPVSVAAPVPEGTAVAEATVPLPSGPCAVDVLAENRSGKASVPATLRIARLAGAPSTQPAELKPQMYVLAIGVADVKLNDAFDLNGDGRVTEEELRLKDPLGTAPFADLGFADADARDVAASFATQEGQLYSKVETRVLLNKQASAVAIKNGLEWIKAQTTARDVGVIFLSGHGENDNEGGFHFVAWDYDPKQRMSTGISFAEIESTIRNPAGKMLFFIDSCHAGNALGKLFAAKGGAAVDINRLVNELSSAENGAVVFASSTGRQESRESRELKHGVFAHAIIEGLQGKADLFHHGTISVSGLEAWVCDRVKEYTDGQQTPTVAKPDTVPDFLIAIKR